AHHARDREPPDVNVDDPDAVSLGRERGRQVHGDGRLADPALAGGHGDHRSVAFGEERTLLDRSGPAAELRHEVLALVLVHLAQDDLDALTRVQDRTHGSSHVGVDAILQGASGDGEQDIDADEPVFDLDPLEHADVLDRLADLGIEDVSKRLANLFFRWHGLAPDYAD